MKIDQKWFDRYSEIADFTQLEFFALDGAFKNRLKKEFLMGINTHPLFEYDTYNHFSVNEKRDAFKSFAQDLKSETNEDIQYLYQKKVAEQLLVLDLIESSKRADDSHYKKATESLYGKPEKTILAKIIPSVTFLLEKASTEPSLKESVAYLRQHIEKCEPSGEEIILLDDHYQGEKVDARQIQAVFSEVLREEGLGFWKPIVDRSTYNTHIRVDSSRQEIIVPGSRSVRPKRLQALVEHEIKVHLNRNRNGGQTVLALLSTGLDNYIKSDEGLGVYYQHQVDELGLIGSVEIYLGLSLAYGFFGGDRDLKHLFDFYKHYYLISRALNSDDNQKAAIDYAWSRCTKLFRGTTAQTPGVVHTRGKVYLEGYFEIRELLESGKMTKDELMVGKYNPLDENHLRILKQLRILV